MEPGSDVVLSAPPIRLNETRVIVELVQHAGRGLYLLDGAPVDLSAVAVPSPARRPYAAVPWSPTEYRVVGLASQVAVGQQQWEYPPVAFEPGGGRAWEHRMVAQALSLSPAPDGNLIVSSSPTMKRLQAYHQWYDLSGETFVRCLGPDGATRWTGYAPGPITHHPVVAPDGTVYVGSDQRLWALAASG